MPESGRSADTSGRIVVGVDGSPHSVDALRRAAELAASLSAEIDAVTVWPYAARYGGAGAPVEPYPDDDVTAALDRAVTRAFGDGAPPGLRRQVWRDDNPAKGLLTVCREAMVLVVGRRGYGPIDGLAVGSVGAACAEHAPCPVLVVHTGGGSVTEPAAPLLGGRIVVGVDGSASSRQAGRWAALLADLGGGEVEALAVRHPDAAEAPAAELRAAEVPVAVRDGDPAEVLIDASRGAGLLVVGSRGLGGFTGLLLGSVGRKCLARAACPVLVVHGASVPARPRP